MLQGCKIREKMGKKEEEEEREEKRNGSNWTLKEGKRRDLIKRLQEDLSGRGENVF